MTKTTNKLTKMSPEEHRISGQNRALVSSDGGQIEPVEGTLPRKRRSPQQVYVDHRQPRSCWSYCGLFGGIALLIVVLTMALMLLAGVNAVTGFIGSPWEDLKNTLGLTSKPARVTDVTVIVEGIREQALLTALEGRETLWVNVVMERPGLLADAKLKMRYTGQVNLGYDLSLITDENIVIEGDRLIMTMPPLQFTGCALHDPFVEQWTCGTSVMGSGNCGDTLNELQAKAYGEGIQQLVFVAQEQHWDEKAFQSAQVTLANLFEKMGYDAFEFRANPAMLPPHESCGSPPT